MKWLVLIVLLVSCHRAEVIPNGCGVDNPLTDLSWLKKLNRNDGLGSSIVQGTYQGQTVYAVSKCGRCYAGPSMIIYRCDGSVICSGLEVDSSPGSCRHIRDDLTETRTLVEYKP